MVQHFVYHEKSEEQGNHRVIRPGKAILPVKICKTAKVEIRLVANVVNLQ